MTAEYPLHWPQGWRRAKSRTRGQFKTGKNPVTYHVAEQRLRDELFRLCGCRSPIISSNMLRTSQPQDPGVALYFQAKDAPMRVIAVDAYDRVEDNIAAIAATIEAMRAIERHGGAQILERAFAGFAALPSPEDINPWAILGLKPGSSAPEIEAKFRELAKKLHPDKPGGSLVEFQKLEHARGEALKKT